jgi:hypothetical protein
MIASAALLHKAAHRGRNPVSHLRRGTRQLDFLLCQRPTLGFSEYCVAGLGADKRHHVHPLSVATEDVYLLN